MKTIVVVYNSFLSCFNILILHLENLLTLFDIMIVSNALFEALIATFKVVA